MKSFLKRQYILPSIYLAIVIVSMLLAFNYEGSLNLNWWLVLFVLTLPWSLVSIIFVWALIHGAGLGIFTVMYLFFALINALLIYLIAKPKDGDGKLS